MGLRGFVWVTELAGSRAAFTLFGQQFQGPDPERRLFCGTDGQLCLRAAAGVWDDHRLAANEFDESDGDCGFSTFVALERTVSPGGDNLHRNVLFRNDSVPDLPLSYVEVSGKGLDVPGLGILVRSPHIGGAENAADSSWPPSNYYRASADRVPEGKSSMILGRTDSENGRWGRLLGLVLG